jgi:hypothetical protein
LEIKTFIHRKRKGWSIPQFPDLDSDRTLVTVFGGSDCLDHPERLSELIAAYPLAHVIGCSTSGEIFDTSIDDDSLSVAVCRFQGTILRAASAPVSGAGDSHRAGTQIGERLIGPGLRAILVVSDGINVNGSELLRGLNEVVPESVIVTGGLAGDGDRFKRTWVVHDRQASGGFVSAVAFYGDRIRIGHGSKGGWDVFGPERVATKSSGNVLFEIDGQPALALYKEYLGERAVGLPGTALLFPLALRESRDSEKSLVRTILSVDEAAQSMTFAGDIPQGGLVRLMRANFDRLIEGASEAARLTGEGSLNTGPSLAIAISCVGRRLVLGQRAEEEVEAAKQALPAGAELVGFYSFGEISPFATGRCDLHNQTMTLTHIEER